MNSAEALHSQLNLLQKRSLIVGVAALVPCVGGVFLSPEQFFRSYLLAYVFWLGLALGSCALVMLHNLTGGAWGAVIRRVLESGMRTLPLMAVLFVPFLFGLPHLYEWAHPEHVASDTLLQYKTFYLNSPFFLLRTGVYFLVWLGLAYLLDKWSVEHERTAEPAVLRRLEALSGPGLVLYGGTLTFAAIDWVMSLEPHWYSTIYGLLFLVGQALATMAFAIIVLSYLADHKPVSEVVQARHFHDLGNLLLAFVMLWAYVTFSQYLIIWSGNLAEEVTWYLHRTQGGWEWIGLGLIVFHFILPFVILLSRDAKRRKDVLMKIAAAVLFMRLVDLFWLIAPSPPTTGFHIHWLDVAAPIGVGGLWLAYFCRQLQGRSFLPLHDPSLAGDGEHAVEHVQEA
jgi:hypothetical protein